MNEFTNFLLANVASIVFILLVVIALAVAWKMGYKKQVTEILFYLVCKAEEEFGAKTGQLKFAAVVAWLYERMPAIAKILFTKTQIDDMIEEAVNRMKEFLSKNDTANKLITSSAPTFKEERV